MEAILVTDYPISFSISPWADHDKGTSRVWVSMSINGGSVYGNISTEKAKALIAALTAVVEQNETVAA